MSIQSNDGGSEIRRSNSTNYNNHCTTARLSLSPPSRNNNVKVNSSGGESCHEYNNNTTTRIKILGGRSEFPLPSTEGAGMKIDRTTIPTFNNLNNSSGDDAIFTITEWNKFCDTINNTALQQYNNTISTHSSSTISKVLILPIIAISILSIILVVFARPVYLGIGIFVCMMVVCIGICLYDRYWRVRFVYDEAVTRLCCVVEWLNHGDEQLQLQQQQQEEGDDCGGGGLMEKCGVRLSVVVTGPISDDDANNNDATSDVEGPNNINEDNDKWNYWTGRDNNVTNLYIEFKRISPPRPSQHYERHESNGSSNGNLQRGRGSKNKQQQQRKATDMIYNEEDQSFSC
jgi:hypothetical protein